jgi:hypothetical protein
MQKETPGVLFVNEIVGGGNPGADLNLAGNGGRRADIRAAKGRGRSIHDSGADIGAVMHASRKEERETGKFIFTRSHSHGRRSRLPNFGKKSVKELYGDESATMGDSSVAQPAQSPYLLFHKKQRLEEIFHNSM